jgi:hypothetical protein
MFASSCKLQRRDWRNWKGLSWQGRFGELPPDIRQKINFLLENENLTLSPDTTLKIIIVPYVGLLTNHGEGSTYTEWFHLLNNLECEYPSDDEAGEQASQWSFPT